MVTKEQALTEDQFHYGNCTRATGPRGGVREHVVVCRRGGATKTWITRPDDFRVPIKVGFKEHGEITHQNCHQFHTAGDCVLLDGKDHGVGDGGHQARVQEVTVSMFGDLLYRAVCTCGYRSTEHFMECSAELSLQKHLESAEQTS